MTRAEPQGFVFGEEQLLDEADLGLEPDSKPAREDASHASDTAAAGPRIHSPAPTGQASTPAAPDPHAGAAGSAFEAKAKTFEPAWSRRHRRAKSPLRVARLGALAGLAVAIGLVIAIFRGPGGDEQSERGAPLAASASERVERPIVERRRPKPRPKPERQPKSPVPPPEREPSSDPRPKPGPSASSPPEHVAEAPAAVVAPAAPLPASAPAPAPTPTVISPSAEAISEEFGP